MLVSCLSRLTVGQLLQLFIEWEAVWDAGLVFVCFKKKGYIWTDTIHIVKELKITPILDKLLEYKRNWIQYINRLPRNRLPRVMKLYSPTGRRIHGRPLKRLLDT
jgi:hypothetical protein